MTEPITSRGGGDALVVKGLTAGYRGRAVVRDVGLDVGIGEVVLLAGANGAGKTTTLKSIVGLVRPIAGEIKYEGTVRHPGRAYQSAVAGISFIPAERSIFAQLSIEDNLRLGGQTVTSAAVREERRQQALELFPILGERLGQRAGTMSGGEQRMLSIAVALMAGPRLLMLDEPSLGLAPAIVDLVMNVIREFVAEGTTSVLMVEQNIGQALKVTDRVYVMRSGRVIHEESASAMRGRDDWWELF